MLLWYLHHDHDAKDDDDDGGGGDDKHREDGVGPQVHWIFDESDSLRKGEEQEQQLSFQ